MQEIVDSLTNEKTLRELTERAKKQLLNFPRESETDRRLRELKPHDPPYDHSGMNRKQRRDMAFGRSGHDRPPHSGSKPKPRTRRR